MAARPDIKAIRQWLWGMGHRAADLAARCFRAARREAAKDKYREYLSDAYGRMKQRYPKVESTALDALDAIGVRTAEPEPAVKAPAKKTATKKAPTRKKTVAKKKTVPGTKKTVTKKTTVARKKTASRKKTQ